MTPIEKPGNTLVPATTRPLALQKSRIPQAKKIQRPTRQPNPVHRDLYEEIFRLKREVLDLRTNFHAVQTAFATLAQRVEKLERKKSIGNFDNGP